MLFDFVRAAFASSLTACTDLSQRLRDGVSLENELVFSRIAPAAPNLHQSGTAFCFRAGLRKSACTTNNFMLS